MPTTEEKNRIKNYLLLDERLKEKPSLAIFQELEAIRTEMMATLSIKIDQVKADLLSALDKEANELIEKMDEVEKQEGAAGHTPTEDELLALIRPLIPEAEHGHTPTDEELLKLIRPLIPRFPEIKVPKDGYTPQKGVDYFDGATPNVDYQKIVAEVLSKVSKELIALDGKEIIQKINELPIKPESQIDASHIKNLRKYLPAEKAQRGGGGDIINIEDLSSLTDGAVLTFTVPLHRKAIMVIGSDFPSVLFEGNGYTVNAGQTQITLTVENAPSSGSQLGFMYTKR